MFAACQRRFQKGVLGVFLSLNSKKNLWNSNISLELDAYVSGAQFKSAVLHCKTYIFILHQDMSTLFSFSLYFGVQRFSPSPQENCVWIRQWKLTDPECHLMRI